VTQKIFWEDPYRIRHEATVTAVNANEISVDSTIFFAFSGGQESDHGTIQSISVLAARKLGVEILYELRPGHGLRVGERVVIEIDWARRYRLMRLHFAAELVLELVYRTLDGVNKVGAHIAPGKARIDFSWPQSISPLLLQLSEAANNIVKSNVEILTGFDDEANERRYWKIDGFSQVPCGGTHVKRTGEIGPIRLKRDNIGKGKERVEIFLDAENARP
jgi:alanyl-tRNA synthetase